MNRTYITEDGINDFLLSIGINNFYRNKNYSRTLKFRPDFKIDDIKVIIEFDGYQHYNNAERAVLDLTRNKFYKEQGFNVIRIPYFIQLSKEVINKEFNYILNIKGIAQINTDFNTYPHGFIDKKALLPAYFCELGIQRFKNDLLKFDYILEPILQSLRNKIADLNDYRLVVYEDLKNLL